MYILENKVSKKKFFFNSEESREEGLMELLDSGYFKESDFNKYEEKVVF